MPEPDRAAAPPGSQHIMFTKEATKTTRSVRVWTQRQVLMSQRAEASLLVTSVDPDHRTLCGRLCSRGEHVLTQQVFVAAL